MSIPEEQSLALSPFNEKGADVVLRSHDGVSFYVFKIILSLASPFFKDMFSLPQPPQPNEHPPVIPCTEDSRTWDFLLRLCYPVVDPVINNLSDVEHVLEAAMKYQMGAATKTMRKLLLAFVDDNALQVYTVACRLQLEAEARTAARHWRDQCLKKSLHLGTSGGLSWDASSDGASFLPEMNCISAGSLFRLLRYIRSPSTTSNFVRPDVPRASESGEGTILHPPQHHDADIIIRSSDGAEFHVHQLIVSLASPTLLGQISPSQDPLPIINVPENGRTLAKLLELCYPGNGTEWGNMDSTLAVLQLASKYQMNKVIWLAKLQCMQLIKTDPLRVFFTAIRYGWEQEAREAARYAADLPIQDIYVPEMEITSAVVYHHLLKYHYECRSAIASLSRIYPIVHGSWQAGRVGGDQGRRKAGDQSAGSARIFAPMVQYELWGCTDLRTLLDKSYGLERGIEEALAKVSLSQWGSTTTDDISNTGRAQLDSCASLNIWKSGSLHFNLIQEFFVS
jgi:BTB/POZ domain